MYLTIATSQGTVIDRIPDLEEYDLNNSFARADLINDIKNAIERGLPMERDEL